MSGQHVVKAAARFSWVKPDVYPLIGTMTVALTMCGYACARHLLVNPTVHINKQRRMDEMASSPAILKEAPHWAHSPWRSVGENLGGGGKGVVVDGGAIGVFNNDCRDKKA